MSVYVIFTPSENRKLSHDLARSENFGPENLDLLEGGGGGILARYTKNQLSKASSFFNQFWTYKHIYKYTCVLRLLGRFATCGA